jgi:putative flippase GtrA
MTIIDLKKEIIFFSIVGFSTVAIDYFFYNFFLSNQILGVNTSKGLSFLIGTAYSYLMNRFFTFSHTAYKDGSILRFLTIYVLALLLNVTVNWLIFMIYSSIALSFFIATGFSAAFNFIGLKFYVFRKN